MSRDIYVEHVSGVRQYAAPSRSSGDGVLATPPRAIRRRWSTNLSAALNVSSPNLCFLVSRLSVSRIYLVWCPAHSFKYLLYLFFLLLLLLYFFKFLLHVVWALLFRV